MHHQTQNGILITKKKKNKKQYNTTTTEVRKYDRFEDLDYLMQKYSSFDKNTITETYDFFEEDITKAERELDNMAESKKNIELNHMLDVEEEMSKTSLNFENSISDTLFTRERSNNDSDLLNEINTQIQSYFNEIHIKEEVETKKKLDDKLSNNINNDFQINQNKNKQIRPINCKVDNEILIIKKPSKKNKKKPPSKTLKWNDNINADLHPTKSNDNNNENEEKHPSQEHTDDTQGDVYIDEDMARNFNRSHIRNN